MEFVAGTRALADYRRANKSAREIAALLSTGRDDAPSIAQQLQQENKELHRRVRELEEVAAEGEAQKLLNETESNANGIRVITKIFSDRDAEHLKKLAHALISTSNTVALLASRDKETARLVFARSADTPGDMNALMRKACEVLDGRGGGKPDMAQGGGKNLTKVEEVLSTAANTFITQP